MKKTVQVLMLPASKYTVGGIVASKYGIVIMQANSVLDLQQQGVLSGTSTEWVGQHLYFTSNEEIKEGDFFINQLNVLYQKTSIVGPHVIAYKVIATTDKSLNLPLIPQSFVEEYVEVNGGIKEVEYTYKDKSNYNIEWRVNASLTRFVSCYKDNSKQTVKEAAKEYTHSHYSDTDIGNKRACVEIGFALGAKWAQQHFNN